MNILAFGSHPDDVEATCFGTLMKCKARGDNIFITLTTSGNIGSNLHSSREEIAAIREKEALAAAKFYGASVDFLRFDDEGVFDTPETRRAFINSIRKADPDVILTHCPWDGSTDHGMTGKIICEVLLSLPGKLVPADVAPIKKAPSVFFWDIPGGRCFDPEIYVDIGEYIEQKIEALKCHESQIPWMNVFIQDDFSEFMRVLSRFRGTQCGCKYAEGFIGYRYNGYIANPGLLCF